MAIDAVVFDLGGVLFADGSRRLRASFGGDDRDRVEDVLRSTEAKRLRRGRISDAEFWSWAAPRLPAGYDVEGFRQAWYDSYVLDPDVWDLVQLLHGRYRLAVFSGNVRSRVEYLDAKYEFRRWFEVETYSYDHGMSKPEPGFVDAMLADVGCSPERIVYVDDRENCLVPARERGVHGLLYRRGAIEPLRNDMLELGVVLDPAEARPRS